jgi:hypothetical protein
MTFVKHGSQPIELLLRDIDLSSCNCLVKDRDGQVMCFFLLASTPIHLIYIFSKNSLVIGYVLVYEFKSRNKNSHINLINVNHLGPY